jgi:hypothetical protein
MNNLCNGSVIVVIHVPLFTFKYQATSLIQLQDIVSLNPISVFFTNMQEQDMSDHQTVCVCACVCVSVTLCFPTSTCEPMNDFHKSMKPGISQWREHHTFRVHMISTNDKADMLNL